MRRDFTVSSGPSLLLPLSSPGPRGLDIGLAKAKPDIAEASTPRKETLFALVDQLRSVDKRRIRRVFRTLRRSEREAIDEGLRLFLGLEAAAD